MATVKIGKRTRRPAAPFTTSTLQQEASRKLSFGTSKTMRVAQQLYEGDRYRRGRSRGSDHLHAHGQRFRLGRGAAGSEAFCEEHYGAEYVPGSATSIKTKAKTAQEAHEAVRPTSVYRSPKKMKQYLKRDQYRLYRLIWERFVASQMDTGDV